MRKALSVLLMLLLIAKFPVLSDETTSEKWVVVFTDYLRPGDVLTIDNYSIRVKISIEGVPYLFVDAGEKGGTFVKVDFGVPLEYENLKITPGSYRSDKGLFLAVAYRVVGEKYPAKIGEKTGEFEVIGVNNNSIILGYFDKRITIPRNARIKIDSLLIEFTGDYVILYHLPDVKIHKEEVSGEVIVSFPYLQILADPGSTLRLPILIINNGSKDIPLTANVIKIPDGWNAEIYYQNVEIGSIILQRGSMVSLDLIISIPKNASGNNSVMFSINEKVFTVGIAIKSHEVKEEPKVVSPILSQEVVAGSEVRFPIMIFAPYDMNISISTFVPENWEAYAIYQGVRVSKVFLQKGESGTFNVIIKVPRNADLGQHDVKVTLSITGTKESYVYTKTFVINVYKTYKGQKATLKLIVVDDSGTPVPRATVEIGNETYGTDINGVLEVELDPSEYEITVTKEGFERARENVKLEDGEVKEIKIMIKREAYYFTVDTESDVYLITLGGASSPFAITIENLGRNDDEYKLSVLGLPNNWNAMFTPSPESVLQITKVKVKAGKSEVVYLKIYPSLNARPGKYNITLVVRSSSGLVREIPIKIDLTGIYQMDVNLMNYRLTITAGEERETVLRMYNFGTAPITNIQVSVSAPKGWEVRIEPQSLPILDPKDSASVMIRVRVPKGTPAGDYRVKITVKSDQQEWSDSIRVVVRQKSTSAYIGLLLLVLAFVGVIIMIRRVGRR